VYSACCFQDGHCEFIERGPCEQAGGSWQEPCVVCDPNPCVTPTRPSTWGKLKTIYR